VNICLGLISANVVTTARRDPGSEDKSICQSGPYFDSTLKDSPLAP
jgi:hypothetical protein